MVMCNSTLKCKKITPPEAGLFLDLSANLSGIGSRHTTCRLRLDKHLDRQSGDGHNSSNCELQHLANRPFLRLHKRKDCPQNARSEARKPCDWQLPEHFLGRPAQLVGCRLYHRYCCCCTCVQKPQKGQPLQMQKQQERQALLKPSSLVASLTT